MSTSIDRPVDLPGTTYKIPIIVDPEHQEKGFMYVNVGGLEGKPLEVFVTIGKAGSLVSIMADTVARLLSCQLQDGADPTRLVEKHLLHTKGGETTFWPANECTILSIPDGVGKAILRWMKQNPPPPPQEGEPLPPI